MLGALAALALAADPRAQLEAVKSRRSAEEAAARLLAERETSILDTLAEAERALAEAEGEAQRVEAERAASEARLREAEEEERRAQARLDRRMRELRPRLAARHRLGALGELKLLLGARSLAELGKRHALLDRILRHDLAALSEARSALEERERARAVRASETLRKAALAAEADKRRADARAQREARRTLLEAIRGAKALHERAAAEAAAQAERLGAFVAALPQRGPPSRHGDFAALRGRLPRPAGGPVAVGFGRVVNPRWSTVTLHKGIDIVAPKGEPVRAVAPGKVVHAGWFKGYGNLVIVDHGGGYHTLVAHLDTMSAAVGEEVEPGALLGTVGETGSLKGPYLYFEIREKGRPVDPRSWLAP